MFEREIKFIIDFNLNKVKRLGAFFTLPDLARSGVHPAIVQYISAELDYLIYIDRQNLLKNSVFDYSGPEINRLFTDIAAEIKKKKLLPFDECRRLLQMAVIFNVNYLLRPRWTLQRFVFENDVPRGAEEVKLFLNYAYFYDYYKNIVLSFIEKRNLTTVTATDLAMLLEKIQKELIQQHKDTVLENGLASIAEFLNTGDVNKTKLSVAAAEYFLREKDCRQEIYKIRALLSQEGRSRYDIEDYRKVFAASLPYPAEADLFGATAAADEEPETGGLFEAVNFEPKKKKPSSEAERFLEEELNSFTRQQEQLAEEREIALNGTAEDEIAETEQPAAETVWHPVVEVSKEENLRQLVKELEALSGEQPSAAITTPDFDEPVKQVILPEPPDLFEGDEVLQSTELKTEADVTAGPDGAVSSGVEEQKPQKPHDTVFHLVLPGDDESTEPATASVPEEHPFTLTLPAAQIAVTDSPVDVASEVAEGPVDAPEIQPDAPAENASNETLMPIIDDLPDSHSISDAVVAEVPLAADESTPEAETIAAETEVAEDESELFSRFSTKETMKIVAGVFNGDSVDFVNTIEQIDECRSVEEADILLNSVFLSYQVNPLTNAEAIMLKARVSAYFAERGTE